MGTSIAFASGTALLASILDFLTGSGRFPLTDWCRSPLKEKKSILLEIIYGRSTEVNQSLRYEEI